MIFLAAGMFFFILACISQYLFTALFRIWNIPSPITLLFSLIAVIVLMVMAWVCWGFMTSFPLGFPFGGWEVLQTWFPQDTVEWEDYLFFYKKHKKSIFLAIAANGIFFICLMNYLLWAAEGNNLDSITRDTSYMIWLIWISMNCAILIMFCIMEILRDAEV